ncbi:Parvulin-like peptidyl-prolyl isomerase [Rubellimicrobium mesophilum DSM 19309]|uniref:Parvulin-like peptidyl-prolyl isomerase n=1 Tax=Rubellimicrobium mesophilum DSM 19309 TaxID=442562 RepID=A0A017HP55_9RHOB|nr:hypothetical protein [Rubellimicrobium mesophilum]EYD76161.1 Parvulin-like peptidyl-prolyl isomerase [Rubellimicrobium mesophilum DSM 19309]
MPTYLYHAVALALAAAASDALAQPELLEAVAARIDLSSTPAEGEPTFAEVRAATERFLDVQVALAEGYVRDPGNVCDTAEMMGRPAELGAMGVHYFRPDLLGVTAPPNPRVDGTGTHTDFRKPAVLIYEPQPDGSLVLVAVENLVFVEAWEVAGHAEPPSFHGVAYDLMVDDPATTVDEAHMFEPHYDRHVWLHRENPSGVFAQYNPLVTYDFQVGAGHQHNHS